jgi:hypothetical protein
MPLDKQQIELIGRAHLEMRLLQAGFEVARPARDKGIDLIAYTDVPGEPFHARPIQMKAASGKIFSLNRNYEGRGIVYAYLWDVLQHPRLFLVPYETAVGMLPAESAQTASWQQGQWYTGRPSAELRGHLERYEDNFDALRPAAEPHLR